MKVTVLMPIFNAERFLHDSIGSLLAQTSNQWNLICIDDGSTDSSKAIVEDYCKKDPRIKLICQENAGPAVARARAIEIADTEYVSILDSDDAYAPDYVEKMLARAEETDADSIVPDVEFGYGNTQKLPNKFVQHHFFFRHDYRGWKEGFCHDYSLATSWMADDKNFIGKEILYSTTGIIQQV